MCKCSRVLLHHVAQGGWSSTLFAFATVTRCVVKCRRITSFAVIIFVMNTSGMKYHSRFKAEGPDRNIGLFWILYLIEALTSFSPFLTQQVFRTKLKAVAIGAGRERKLKRNQIEMESISNARTRVHTHTLISHVIINTSSNGEAWPSEWIDGRESTGWLNFKLK